MRDKTDKDHDNEGQQGPNFSLHSLITSSRRLSVLTVWKNDSALHDEKQDGSAVCSLDLELENSATGLLGLV